MIKQQTKKFRVKQNPQQKHYKALTMLELTRAENEISKFII